jgi:hypothetical protein
MRIRLTLELSDGLRRHVAQALALQYPRKTRDGRAARRDCIAWLQRKLTEANLDWNQVFPQGPRLSELEQREAAEAVDYMRKAGRTDEQIRAWLLKQRARAAFPMHCEADVMIAHAPDCPVAQPGFMLPTKADGTVDTDAPSQCRCDFGKRLREYLEAHGKGPDAFT